jgi:UDP-N-acetylglucosamine/UDP-N-acetylgalactosamine diphosphorylase
LPALDYDGKIIIENEGKISLAPGGNGALYSELARHGMIEDMKARNIKYVNFGAIDNILLKLADPLAIGYMIKNNRDIVSKVITKRSWE